MNLENKEDILKKIPVNYKLIDDLYYNKKITKEAKEYSINILRPYHELKLFLPKILYTIGLTLILVGVIFFLSFYWHRIDSLHQIIFIELSIISFIIGAYLFSLNHILGKILLFLSSILVGVLLFLYQERYLMPINIDMFFFKWFLIILIWTLISNFLFQWTLCFLLLNLTLLFNSLFPLVILCVFFTIMNGLLLGLREYLVDKKIVTCLKSEWVRVVMLAIIAFAMSVPIILLIIKPDPQLNHIISEPFNIHNNVLFTCAFISVIGFIIFYFISLYKFKNIWSLFLLILSISIVIWVLLFRIVDSFFNFPFPTLLIMGVLTLAIFTIAILHLKKLTIKIEKYNV